MVLSAVGKINLEKTYSLYYSIKNNISEVSALLIIIFIFYIFILVPLQLNRPFITLLNDLGVRHRIFLRLQEEMLKKLTDMLFNESKAAEFLKSKTPCDLFNYEALSESGIYLTNEPFFKSLLLALHRHHIGKVEKNIKLSFSKFLFP